MILIGPIERLNGGDEPHIQCMNFSRYSIKKECVEGLQQEMSLGLLAGMTQLAANLGMVHPGFYKQDELRKAAI